MEMRNIIALYEKELSRSRDALRNRHARTIVVPVESPFLIGGAKSQIDWNAKRQKIVRQSAVFLGEGLFPRPVDIWQMREDFLSIKRTDHELQYFLDKYGWWDNRRRSIRVNEIWHFRELFKLALLWPQKTLGKQLSGTGFRGLPGLFAATLQASFEYREGMPLFIATANGCADALILSLLCDVVAGRRFKKCAREGCDEIFEITARLNRQYHSSACQHAALIRRGREEHRKKKARIRAITRRSI
jgi:hypothetical protein